MIYISKLRPTVRVIKFNEFGDLMTDMYLCSFNTKSLFLSNVAGM